MASRRADVSGKLQAEVMQTLWDIDEGTVDDLRAAQPAARRVAYTTMQTVLNRLCDRGLVRRRRRGKAYVYRARYDESQLVARSLRARLADASTGARTQALLHLIEGLEHDELDEIARYASRIRRQRSK